MAAFVKTDRGEPLAPSRAPRECVGVKGTAVVPAEDQFSFSA
jgi:hypothetical protein